MHAMSIVRGVVSSWQNGTPRSRLAVASLLAFFVSAMLVIDAVLILWQKLGG